VGVSPSREKNHDVAVLDGAERATVGVHDLGAGLQNSPQVLYEGSNLVLGVEHGHGIEPSGYSMRDERLVVGHISEHMVHEGHDAGHGPKGKDGTRPEDATLLIDATLKREMPPLALPKREYMERAKELWEELGLPPLNPESPWHGYSLGDWTEEWDRLAERAAEGDYLENGKRSAQRRRSGVKPNTHVRSVPDWDQDQK